MVAVWRRALAEATTATERSRARWAHAIWAVVASATGLPAWPTAPSGLGGVGDALAMAVAIRPPALDVFAPVAGVRDTDPTAAVLVPTTPVAHVRPLPQVAPADLGSAPAAELANVPVVPALFVHANEPAAALGTSSILDLGASPEGVPAPPSPTLTPPAAAPATVDAASIHASASSGGVLGSEPLTSARWSAVLAGASISAPTPAHPAAPDQVADPEHDAITALLTAAAVATAAQTAADAEPLAAIETALFGVLREIDGMHVVQHEQGPAISRAYDPVAFTRAEVNLAFNRLDDGEI
jgi:hypothetical protein